MHCPVVRRLWRGCLGLSLVLSGCTQSSAPSSELDGAGSKLAPKAAAGPTLAVAAHDATTTGPVDATPSPDGSRIYYLAVARDEADEPSAGVFAVDSAAAGSGKIDRLALGAP